VPSISLIFAIAFASFLLANEVSIFVGIMTQPSSQIQDVVDTDIWVMDRKPLLQRGLRSADYDLYRVRSVLGMEWAVPLYKGNGRAKGPDGRFRTVISHGARRCDSGGRAEMGAAKSASRTTQNG
jgi:putative ABC transport system permease protein